MRIFGDSKKGEVREVEVEPEVLGISVADLKRELEKFSDDATVSILQPVHRLPDGGYAATVNYPITRVTSTVGDNPLPRLVVEESYR